ncbi:MAG: acetyltransferase [Anaerolineae bacterium]
MNRNAKPVYILGAGGHAKVVIATVQAAGSNVQALYDDDPRKWGQSVLDVPIVGAIASVDAAAEAGALVALGDNATRKAVAEQHPTLRWEIAVHPNADVHPSVTLGAGTVVFSGAVVQPGAVIGRHCIINTGATVDHDCVIGDYAHIAPGVHLAGQVTVGEGAFLGIGSVAIVGVTIGAWATVGAGAVVITDIPPGATAVGVPAKVIR